jgi:hypothetical protein
MQGLINFTTAIADSIAVLLPAFCYLMACSCFFYFAWTLWTWSDTHSRYHHPHRLRPWVPFLSLVLCGVFATFLNMANVSAGTDLGVDLTQYTPTTPPNASNVLGTTPDASMINIVTLFQYFFQVFGAACVAWAIVRFRGIVNAHIQGSPTSCFVQFVFGICCVNIVTIATGVEQFFQTGS